MKRIISLLLTVFSLLQLMPLSAEAKTTTRVVNYTEEVATGIYTDQQKTVTVEEPDWPAPPDASWAIPATDTQVSTWSIRENNGRYYIDNFADLKEMASQSYAQTTYVYYNGTEELVISSNLTVPQNMYFYAQNGKVTVAKGVTFSCDHFIVFKDLEVKGTANLGHTKIYGSLKVTGKINVNSSIEVEAAAISLDKNEDEIVIGMDKITAGGVCFRPNVHTQEELTAYIARAKVSDAQYVLFLQDDFVISKSVTVPENCSISSFLTESVTVAKGCTLTVKGRYAAYTPLIVKGKLVNQGRMWVYADGYLKVETGGSYSGNSYIYIYDGVTAADAVKGLDLDDFDKMEYISYTVLRYAGGLPRLAKPTNLKWGKLEDFAVWESGGNYTVKDITTPGAFAFKPADRNAQYMRICFYNTKDDTPFMTWDYYLNNPMEEWCSQIYFLRTDPESGTYYFTVTAIGDGKNYRDSVTVKSANYTYTKPSKAIGSCKNISWAGWDTVTFERPSTSTYVGGYEIALLYTPNKDEIPNQVVNCLWYYGTKEELDIAMLFEETLNTIGAGTYACKVRALSSDITVRKNGSWSDHGSPIYLSHVEAKVTNVASSGKPKITWNKIGCAEKYEVYRSTSKNGTYSRLGSTTGTGFINTSAVVGKTYYYKVRPVISGGTKTYPFSNIVSRTCDLPKPTGLSTRNVASSGKIKITWDTVEGAEKYEVYRATSKDGSYSRLGSTTGTGFINTSAVAGKTYYYKVKAIHGNSAANSAYSNAIYHTCDLAKPDIKVSNVSSTGKIRISWTAVEGAAKYEVYRATSKDGSYSRLGSTTGTGFINTSAVTGETYYYKVMAIHEKSAANSAYSSIVSRTCDLPRPDVTLTLNASGKPRLRWNAVQGAAKYVVYRATSKDGTYSRLGSTTGTGFINTSAVAGKTYYYKVMALHSADAANSAYSRIVTITAK